NSASATVDQVNIDLTKPSISASATTADSNAYTSGTWTNQDVTVSFASSDGLSGIASSSAPVTLTTEGAGQSATGTATDKAGNSESSKSDSFKIDATAPSISGAATTSPNGNGWYNSSVTVHFTASDATSGLASVTPDQTLSGEGANQSVMGTAVDNAGNSAS